MIIHMLKTHPPVFGLVVSGKKRFEFRRNDRGPRFSEGDMLCLTECVPRPQGFSRPASCKPTGERWYARVEYILLGPGFGVPQGYCVMSLDHEPGLQDERWDDHSDAEEA